MTDEGYDAFISYKRSSHLAARRLRDDLYSVAKRHRGDDGLRVFLDTAHLRPGSLTAEIRAAVEKSRNLVVVLDTETVESPWVAAEVEHWLATGGTRDRLFLVRVDERLDLAWGTSGFRSPQGIPAPLRDLFAVEQKWVDYAARPLLRSRDGIAGLCSKLMDVDPAEYLQEEAIFQRRRTRTISAVAVVLAVAVAFAVVNAVRANDSAAEARRNEREALAQADASEALLAAADSPTLAIGRALRAANTSGSPTVRSAMLAVSQANRRLKRAVVYPDTGHPADGARFTTDGTQLLAWGKGRDAGTSHVHGWTVATGATAVDTTVDATELRDVVRLGDDRLAGCAASGPVVVDLAAATTTRLDGGQDCEVHQYADGVVLHSAGTAYSVTTRGKAERIDGVTAVAADLLSRTAAVVGPAGVTLVTAAGPVPVTTTPGVSVSSADSQGFLVGFDRTHWGVAALQDGAGVLRPVTVPDAAADVALVPGRDDLAWLTDDGVVGWTRDDRTTTLVDATGTFQRRFATTLEPLSGGRFAAVHHNTATIVIAPTDTAGWTTTPVRKGVGQPATDGANPVVGRCGLRGKALLGMAESGSVLVEDVQEAVDVPGHGVFTAGCDVVATGDALTALPDLRTDSPVLLRATLVADSVAVSPNGAQVAVLKAGFPIEVLSTLPTSSLPRPWDVTRTNGGAVVAFGERELRVWAEEFLNAGTTGDVSRIPVRRGTDLVAAKPDGTGAVLVEVQPERLLLVDGSTVTPAAAACAGKPVTYLPRKDFARSTTDAEAQIPTARTGSGTVVDCRDGSELAWDQGREVVDYDVGGTSGRIVTRLAGRVAVTTWTRGEATGPTTVDGPSLPAENGVVSFDPTGRLALVHEVRGRHLTLYRRDGETWTTALSIPTGLPGIAAAQVVDGGSLVLALSPDGGFEVFDVDTGRLLASDPVLLTSIAPHDVTGFSARRVGDRLSVGVRSGGSPSASAEIAIPVGIPALKRQLCGLFAAEEC